MTSNCLCCQKPLSTDGRYHPRCLSRLFDTARLPIIPFGVKDMSNEIVKIDGHMSISGVQMKVSVGFNKKKGTIETLAKGGTHILKPEPERFIDIPQNENLCMNMAGEMGMPVPPHGLFYMADGKPCYMVRRFDRTVDGDKLQTETMYQILGSKNKYSGSLESVGKALSAYTTRVGIERIDFFERVIFCFLIGNGDMHLKNWAVLIQDKKISLSPCYDLVCSKIYIPDEDESALTINGRQNKLGRKDFKALAGHLKIDPNAMDNVFEKFAAAEEKLIGMCMSSELDLRLKQKIAGLISSRYRRIYK